MNNMLKGVLIALAVHAVVLLFGGLLFFSRGKDHGSLQQVALISEQEIAQEKEKAKDKEQEERKPKDEELQSQEEKAPDSAEMIRSLEVANSAPALEAASLSSIEAALGGNAPGGGEFSEALSFSSGGRIGGTGKAGALDDSLEKAFSLAEIDQKPRVIFQTAPVFPAGVKAGGVVTLIFVVDSTGKVVNPRVEKSSNTAFERPALDAVRQWRFEPAVKAGQRVSCKMRSPIRFQPT